MIRTLSHPVGVAPHVVMLLLDPYERDARVEKEAASLVRAGCRVTVLAWDRFGTSLQCEERDGASIERLPLRCPSGAKWRALLRFPRLYWWYARRAMSLRFDVLIAHEIYTWPVGWLLRVARRRPVVFDAHEPHAEHVVEILPPVRRFLPLLRHIEGYLARRADILVTVTPRMVERYQSFKVPRVFYLPNFPECASAPLADLRPPVAPLVIGRVGSIIPHHSGVESILQLGAVLHRRGVAVKVRLAGPIMNGWEPAFRALVHAGEESIEYLGVIPVHRVLATVASLDIMLSLRALDGPTAIYGYSTKILEAMAVGVPVISTAAGEDGAVVSESECGEIVDYPVDIEQLADRLLSLWGDTERRRRYRENGIRATRTRYNWQVYETAFVQMVVA